MIVSVKRDYEVSGSHGDEYERTWETFDIYRRVVSE
jgi:hypothetical protein